MDLHVSIPEAVWTFASLAGAGFQIRAAHASWIDRRTLDKVGVNGAIRLLASGRLRGSLVGFAVKMLFAGIGVYAMFQPDPVHVSTGELILTGVLVAGVVLLTLNSALDDRDRIRLREYVRGDGA